MRISDWSSDVCSSDRHRERINENSFRLAVSALLSLASLSLASSLADEGRAHWSRISLGCTPVTTPKTSPSFFPVWQRSEEHTSELQSLMRISYAVFCLKKKKYAHYTIILPLLHQLHTQLL